jgi:hypothetical protein
LVPRFRGVGGAMRKGRKARVQMRMVSSILVEGSWMLRELFGLLESWRGVCWFMKVSYIA